MIHPPTFDEERGLHKQGYRFIAGIDEVGRGAIAGPVVAAAVIMPFRVNIPWLSLVRDSKQLSPSKRKFLFDQIQKADLPIGIGMVPQADIDEYGIVKSTQLAMSMAVDKLPFTPDFLLIDALALPEISLPQRSIVHGDQLSLSIACASIVAKVSRDRYMVELDSLYPDYGLARHKGYGTREHLLSLQQCGPSPLHRHSFAPVWRSIKG